MNNHTRKKEALLFDWSVCKLCKKRFKYTHECDAVKCLECGVVVGMAKTLEETERLIQGHMCEK